jgi:intracellular sulfur oxidation DsrE/DsrF family protein
MIKPRLTKIFMGVLLFSFFLGSPMVLKAEDKAVKAENEIHIDIPVKLREAKVVFIMDHLAFTGDLPIGIKYMELTASRFKEMGTKGHIIGLFYGQAAYLVINDKAYNAYRRVKTGNPYKDLIADLIRQGVQIEECAFSMKMHNWKNQDLLPGVKVHTGALVRLIQLTQEGYIHIQP